MSHYRDIPTCELTAVVVSGPMYLKLSSVRVCMVACTTPLLALVVVVVVVVVAAAAAVFLIRTILFLFKCC